MNSSSLKSVVSLLVVAAVSSAYTETIDQTNSNPAAGTDWNQASVWGGSAPIPSNDYATVSTGATIGNGLGFTANGTPWTVQANLRDSQSTSTFGGGSLILNAGTRLLMKGNGGNVSTANIVMNGGFIQAAPNAGGSTALAGTIDTGTILSAIGTNPSPNSTFTLDIFSTIIGSGILQLVNAGENGTRVSHINLLGDYSSFTGTLFLTQADNIPSSAGSSFSIASGSAPLATLELVAFSTNFLYDLSTNVSFGTVIINGSPLAPGTYGFTELNELSFGSFTDNGGTITVAPGAFECHALGILGLGAVALAGARRRRRLGAR